MKNKRETAILKYCSPPMETVGKFIEILLTPYGDCWEMAVSRLFGHSRSCIAETHSQTAVNIRAKGVVLSTRHQLRLGLLREAHDLMGATHANTGPGFVSGAGL